MMVIEAAIKKKEWLSLPPSAFSEKNKQDIIGAIADDIMEIPTQLSLRERGIISARVAGRRLTGSMPVKCKVCGTPVKRKGHTYCSYRCAGLARQHYRVCIVCGETYKTPPSASRITCGKPECVSAHKVSLVEAGVYDEVMRKMLAAKAECEILRKGSPDHVNARSWVIQSPDGDVYECRNLLQWLREHEDMLDGTISQAWNGISKIKYSMQGKRKNPSYQWKGWRLLRWGD